MPLLAMIFGADYAGKVRAVQRCPLDRDAHTRSLDDGVLLSMHSIAELVPRSRGYAQLKAHAFALFRTAADPGGRAVVSGRQDALVAHDHSPYLPLKQLDHSPMVLGQLDEASIPLIHKGYLLFWLA